MSILSWQPFTEEEEFKIVSEIKEAEQKTSGEIRVHIDRWCKNNAEFKARNLFTKLKMEDTEERNGVLIYIAIEEKKFAIIGDSGIDEKVPPDFWDSTALAMETYFRNGKVAEGICEGISECGKQLASYFPASESNSNDLPDDISYGA